MQSNINLFNIIEAIDILPKKIPPTKITQSLNCNQSETGGLVSVLKVNWNGEIMLTVYIDLQERLINGQNRNN